MSDGRVVVGVSGSLGSLAALRAAVQLARDGGRTLIAVTVWQPPEGEGLYARHPDRLWLAQWWRAARDRLERALEEAVGGRPADVPLSCKVVRGRPGRVLCAAADRPEDVLVLGARRGAWRMWTRRYVQRHAVCGVLVVPAPRPPRRAGWALRRATVGDFAVRR